MKITYGSYEFDDNTVGMDMRIVPKRDKRGRRRFTTKEVTLRGKLRAANQSAFKTAIEAFETAFTTDLQDFKLLHDDDSDSAHTMINSETYGGVRCGPIRWGNDTPAEYATVRSFEVTLTADYITSGIEVYSEYEETVAVQGTGAGQIVYTPCLDGTVGEAQNYPRVPVTVVQSGSARGSISYPPFPGFVLGTQYLQGPQVVKERIGPRKELNVNTDYGIRWRYVFQLLPSAGLDSLYPRGV